VPNAALRWVPSSLAQVAPDARGWKPAKGEQSPPSSGSKLSQHDKDPKMPLGVIWVKEGEFVRPVAVNVGTSDGTHTALAGDVLHIPPGKLRDWTRLRRFDTNKACPATVHSACRPDSSACQTSAIWRAGVMCA